MSNFTRWLAAGPICVTLAAGCSESARRPGGSDGGADAIRSSDFISANESRGPGSDAAGAHDRGTGPISTVSSLTKDGITWTFSQPVQAGQFLNGDYYVIGPVTVSAISPQPTQSAPYLNGSVLNLPTANGKSGFDSRLNDGVDESWWFDASHRVYPPIALEAGDALVSSISLATTHSVPEQFGSTGDMNISPVKTVSILTVVGAALPVDAFRPSYCDRKQKIYFGGDLQRGLLPSLAPPKPDAVPSLAHFEEDYRRPWLDLSPFNFDVPAEYMPAYGQRVAISNGFVALLLALDFPAAQKVNLTNYFVQYGIDLYGCLQAGYSWPAFGGHRSGRKLPIVVAALLLDDAGMKNVSTAYPNSFGEDMQTVAITKIPGGYTKAWQGATVIYGGHYGVKIDGQPTAIDQGADPLLYGPYEQLPPSNTNWPLLGGSEQLGEAYRRCCTSNAWIGEALAVHLLKAESIWNYQAFFDYADRWMTEDDSEAVQTIKTNTNVDYGVGDPADWRRQRQTRYYLQGRIAQNTFIDDMWAAYRK